MTPRNAGMKLPRRVLSVGAPGPPNIRDFFHRRSINGPCQRVWYQLTRRLVSNGKTSEPRVETAKLFVCLAGAVQVSDVGLRRSP